MSQGMQMASKSREKTSPDSQKGIRALRPTTAGKLILRTTQMKDVNLPQKTFRKEASLADTLIVAQ